MNTMLMTAATEDHGGVMAGLSMVGAGAEPTPLLLFTLGERAATAVSGAMALGEQWFGTPPPVWRLDLPSPRSYRQTGESATAGLRQQLTMLCATVAAEGGAAIKTHRGGNGHAPPALLPLWLVVDVSAGARDGQAVGAQRGEQALHLLQMLDVVAWQRLQMAVRPRVLLLAATGDQQSLDACRQRLEVMATEPYWVVGVTAAEGEEDADPKAATTTAALLWGTARLPTVAVAFQPKPVRYYAVGAGVRLLPTAELRHALALWGLLAALRASEARLGGMASADETPTVAPEAPLGAWVRQLFAQGATLTERVPGPVAVCWGRGRPRWWRQALAPTRMLLAQRQVEQSALRTAQRTARQQWLATQLTAWTAAWQRFHRRWLTSHPTERRAQAASGAYDGGAYDGGAYEAALAQLWSAVLAQAQAIDEALATLADQTTGAQAAVQRHSDLVDAACAAVPTLSLIGLWQWWTEPRQWGRRLWTLAITLPRRLHGLAQAVAACEAAVYQEANLHLVRQLGLAILQDLQVQRAWLPTMRGYLRDAITQAEAQLAEQVATLPAPWTPLLVATLWQELTARAGGDQAGRAALDHWLQPTAAAEWTTQGADGMVAALIAAFRESSAVIEEWSAADWLTAMFPQAADKSAAAHQRGYNGAAPKDPAQTQADAALWAWLDELAAAAQPAWPATNAGVGWRRPTPTTAEGWLLLPTPSGEQRAAGQPYTPADVESWLVQQQREARVITWLKAHTGWQRGESALSAMLAVQRWGIE